MRKKTFIFEAVGFFVAILFIWFNEIADLPHVLFNAPETPVNITESIIESVIVLLLAVITILVTGKLLRRIRYLEGFMRICIMCNKVYDIERAEWIELKEYFDRHYDFKYFHGYCPECSRKMHVG